MSGESGPGARARSATSPVVPVGVRQPPRSEEEDSTSPLDLDVVRSMSPSAAAPEEVRTGALAPTDRPRRSDGHSMSLVSLGLWGDEGKDRGEIGQLRRVVPFLGLLLVVYIAQRALLCHVAGWSCHGKNFTLHYEDLSRILLVGGALHATGPALVSGMRIRSVLVFLLSLLAAGSVHEIPWVTNNMTGARIWTEASLPLTMGIIAGIVAICLYALWATPSRDSLVCSCYILGALVAFYVGTAIYDRGSMGRPPMFETAWHLCLLLRNDRDRPTILLRWALLGVFVHGVGAYGGAVSG